MELAFSSHRGPGAGLRERQIAPIGDLIEALDGFGRGLDAEMAVAASAVAARLPSRLRGGFGRLTAWENYSLARLRRSPFRRRAFRASVSSQMPRAPSTSQRDRRVRSCRTCHRGLIFIPVAPLPRLEALDDLLDEFPDIHLCLVKIGDFGRVEAFERLLE